MAANTTPKAREGRALTGSAHFLDHLKWRQPQLAGIDALPPAFRSWLTDSGSLTRRLQHASGGQFSVQVRSQSLQFPKLSERTALLLPPRRLALVREVILFGRGEPWVYARSVIPLTTLTGHLRKLRHLDSRPLGALLFSDPTMTREPMQCATITPRNVPLAAPLENLATPIWGRRSVFNLSGKPLLVCEIFLPSFPAYAP